MNAGRKLPWIIRAFSAVLALAGAGLILAIWSDHSPFETNAGAVPISLLTTAFSIILAYVAITGRSPVFRDRG